MVASLDKRTRRPLGKTESELLAQLNRRGLAGVTMCHGHGPEGGKVNGGDRQWNAAKSLIERGLAVEVARHFSRDTRQGFTVHVAELSFRHPDYDPAKPWPAPKAAVTQKHS